MSFLQVLFLAIIALVSQAQIGYFETNPVLADEALALAWKNALVSGLDPSSYMKNGTNCANRMFSWFYTDLITFRADIIAWTDGDPPKYFLRTNLFQDFINDSWFCLAAVHNFYQYNLEKFPLFGSTTMFILAFFQNLLGGSAKLIISYQKIIQYQADNNKIDMYEEVGRIIKTLLIFDPVETASLEGPASYWATLLTQIVASMKTTSMKKVDRLNESINSFKLKGVEELETAAGVSLFVQGFANGTSILSGPDAALCSNSLYNLYGGINEIVKNVTYLANKTNEDRGEMQIYGVLHNMWYLAWNSHPMQEDCFNAGLESATQSQQVQDVFADPSLLEQNLLLNFGLMYDSIKHTTYFFMGEDPYNQNLDAFNAGLKMGQVIYYLFYF